MNYSTPHYVSSTLCYDPFGMLLVERNWQSATTYKYGFQGQENITEVYGVGNFYSFEYRVYDSRLNRFLSVDPLSKGYPHNSPYAFAENRPIDGIDLEGTEYITYLVSVYGNGKAATIIKLEDFRGQENFDYAIHSESFGPEGKGIKYIYQYVDDAGAMYFSLTLWEMEQSTFALALGYHGLYMGSGSISNVGLLFDPEKTGNDYSFIENPIDGVDAVARIHDEAASWIPDSKGWLEDNRTLESDFELVKGFDNYYNTHLINKYSRKTTTVADTLRPIDPYTGRTASYEALTAAKTGSIFFGVVIRYKDAHAGQIDHIRPKQIDHQFCWRSF